MGPFDREAVLSILDESETRLTALKFIEETASRMSMSLREAKKILNLLIREQYLCYHDMYGATYVEKNFLKPVQVTRHFILKPPGFSSTDDPDKKVITIAQGISFGSGQHPTTRLCLKAIDYFIHERRSLDFYDQLQSADIGTGSGVLALALVKCGFSSCCAYEIDPVSVNEAKKNIEINKLDREIAVVDGLFVEKPAAYSMICANLRYPTLMNLSQAVNASLSEKSGVILSGIREWEKNEVISCYEKLGLTLVWQEDLKKWSGLGFEKC